MLTGWATGERHWGGYTQKQRVKAAHLLPLPKGMSPQRAMAIGTAGLTAMLSVLALERHGLKPDQGEVLVTGATGGLGSIAVAILATLGYKVAGSTGKADMADYLKSLGATTIVDRKELSDPGDRPLESSRWAGAVDTVGGVTLARVVRPDEHPWLRRGVRQCRRQRAQDDGPAAHPARRQSARHRFELLPRGAAPRGVATPGPDLPMDKLDAMTEVVPLKALPDLANKILKGQIGGRVVIDVNA